MDYEDVKVILGKALEIEAGKTYVIQNKGLDIPEEWIDQMLRGLSESTGAKFIYLSSNMEITRESNGFV